MPSLLIDWPFLTAQLSFTKRRWCNVMDNYLSKRTVALPPIKVV
jgi:hypothetical protein